MNTAWMTTSRLMRENQQEKRKMQIHELKTDPAVFEAVARGDKTHEIRLNDRNFRVGDTLLLRKTVSSGEYMKLGSPLVYTGRTETRTISHIQTGYGLSEDWCILSFAASPVQGAASATDVCAEMRAMCSNCGGTGDVTRADGEWMGRCTCPYGASGAKGAAVELPKPWREYECHGDSEAERLKLADDEIAALRAALAELAQVQPSGAVLAGWKMVPIEPTEEMDAAARAECHRMQGVIDPVIHVWDAMLAATPAPEQEAAQVEPVGYLLEWRGGTRSTLIRILPCKEELEEIGSDMVVTALGPIAAPVEQEAAQVGAVAGVLTLDNAAKLARGEIVEIQPIESGIDGKMVVYFTAPVPATTPAEQPEGDSSHVMRPFGAPAGQHGAETVVMKKAVLRNELAMIIGCLDGRNGTQKADAVMGWIERYGWPASETFLGATNTNQPEGEKGGAA